MKGRGTRTCSLEELRLKGTPSAKYSKDHFVIIDAYRVESSQKTDSRPLEKAPGVFRKMFCRMWQWEILRRNAHYSGESINTIDRQINEKENKPLANKPMALP
jgi:type I site-specific restriction endonuclease